MNQDLSTRPSYLNDLDERGFAENIGFTQPARISMKDDRFNVFDENNTTILPPSLQLQVIMLAENDTRIYYPKGSYDPDAPVPPSCFSDNGVTPSVGAVQPQSDLCATCPRAVWDQETPNGNLVPACDSRYKVACLVAGAQGRTFLLSIPPASRRAYEQYRKFLKTHHASPKAVITRLDYEKKKFGFSFEGWINERVADLVRQVSATDEPALIVNSMDKPRTMALPTPKPRDPEVEAAEAYLKAHPDFAAKVDALPPLPSKEVVEPPKRRGRPPKEPAQALASSAAQPTPTPFVSARTEKPAFLHDPTTINHNPPPAQFGMEAAQSPPQDIQDALNRAFGR